MCVWGRGEGGGGNELQAMQVLTQTYKCTLSGLIYKERRVKLFLCNFT